MKTVVINEIWEQVEDMMSSYLEIHRDDLDGLRSIAKRWRRNKAWLFPYFDENGRRTVSIKGDSREIESNDIRDVFRSMNSGILNIIEKNDEYRAIFGADGGSYAVRWLKDLLMTNFLNEEIITNRLLRPMHSGRTTDAPYLDKGTKLTTFLKSFIMYEENKDPVFHNYKVLDKEERSIFTQFIVTIFSQIISNIKPRDCKVVISINPIDILLSSSHTAGGWRSCHNVFNGECKTGPLSYVVDNCSLVAYSYTDKCDFIVKSFKLSNQPLKLWRQMVYFDTDKESMLFSRQYPNLNNVYSNKALEIGIEILKEIAHKKGEKPSYTTKDINYSDLSRLYSIDFSKWHYSDAPTAVVIKNPERRISISNGASRLPCIKCGSLRGAPRRHSSLLCNECLYR